MFPSRSIDQRKRQPNLWLRRGSESVMSLETFCNLRSAKGVFFTCKNCKTQIENPEQIGLFQVVVWTTKGVKSKGNPTREISKVDQRRQHRQSVGT